jgi:hypothetical protein
LRDFDLCILLLFLNNCVQLSRLGTYLSWYVPLTHCTAEPCCRPPCVTGI